jgi:ribosomal protein L16 Arg81 hydroxylase
MIDLATLVAPLEPEEFLQDYWPNRPYWSNGVAERIEALAEIPELESAETAMAGAQKVIVFRPDGKTGNVPSGEAAMPLYRMGLTCYLGSRHIPALWEGVSRITADLGLPQGAVKCEIFCSSGDSGVTMHSDFDLNFALLLRGNKRWRIAPNRHIRNQTGVCRPGNQDQPDPGQLEIADRVPFPDEMPAERTELEFEDGGALFMPRGWWHETKASGECLQVNFVINWPQWTNVLTAALKRRLKADPEWRAYAYDVCAPGERRERAVEEFAGLLGDLREMLGADDLSALARELIDDAELPAPGAQLPSS